MKKHRVSLKVIAAVTALVALSACAPEFNPPADYQGGFLWDSDKSRTIAVQPGDTLATISRRYNVPSQVIIARNGLAAPYTLTAGQQLILDPTRSHLVVRGDTLSQLAITYNVEMRLIADANSLTAPYLIKVGQSLWIPDPFTMAAAPAGRAAVAQAAQIAEAAPPPPAPAPRAPRAAIVEESLAPPPGAAPPSTVFGAPVMSAPIAATADAAGAAAAGASVAGAVASAPVAAEPDETEVALALPPQPISEPQARASARFAWPLEGKVIAAFGAAGAGLHNDGINIVAKEGAQVRAADNGVVAYAGNELKGFGNLLLIKHADGWTTAYAHNEKLLVKRGDEVKQGQAIAVVGRTGNVDTPQLHFEVRKGTQALDPMNYLAE